MPVRSSICAYSPSGSSSKYSSAAPSSLSIGHYKPLSSLSTSSPSSSGVGGNSYLSPASSTLSSRYSSASSSSSYSPATYSTLPSRLLSAYSNDKSSVVSSPSSSSSSSSYRPLGSAPSSYGRHLSSPTVSSGAGGRYSSTSSSSLSSAGSSLLDRTENLLGSSSSGYSSSTIGNHYLTYHPKSPSTSTGSGSSSSSSGSSGGGGSSGRRRLSRTSFDGSSSADSLSVSHTSTNSTRSPSQYRHRHLSSLSSSSSAQQQQQQLPSDVPRGLVNLGNTCYMNSAIQSLYSIETFRNLILRSSSPGSYDKPLQSELCSLFRSMKDSQVPLSPRNFHNAFSRRHQTKFTEYHQQDAQEFLRYLINSVHEECNRASSKRARSRATPTPTPRAPRTAEEAWAQYREIVDDSPFVDLLVGQMCSTIICSACQNKSLCWDPFWDLSLPLQRGRHGYGSSRLSDVIDDFCAKETLDGDERPVCGQCKAPTRSTKQIKLSRLPRLLILHLKKFSNDGYKLTSPDVKIDKQLTFNEDTNYQLSACISHHGHSSSSGHYTSHCKYSTSWFHFNDDRVRDVTSSFDSAKLEDAYVLFYTQQPKAATTITTSNNHQSKL